MDLSEMKCLTELFVSDEPLTVDDNPMCTLVGFRVTLLEGLPQTLKVDSYSREVPSKNPSILEPDALLTKELELERNFRAKSEAFQECLMKKLEALSERSDNHNSDLVLNNVKLKERLA
ncbi:unnamed protein product, partial [Hydatigera taeniaeformis]|uniref:RWD domain-containing protein n=1 Tax=Hydatigena taeniaeformis TaxID=6205 RepID=A0A0R3WVJ8_HYDTA